MNRPYAGHSIDQLEVVFETSEEDRQALAALADELTFRKTARARTLATKVRQAMHAGPERPEKVPRRPPDAQVAPGVPHAPTTPPSLPASRKTAGPPSPVSAPMAPTSPAEDAPEMDFTNRPVDLLDAWTALEVLSPQTYRREAELAGGSDCNIVQLDRGLPWEHGPAPSKPNNKVYFHVVLGTLAAAPAFEALIDRFKDSRAEPPGMAGNIVLASILVDKNGVPAGDMPLSISAFGWGFPIALRGSLKDLAHWTRQEGGLVEGLRRQLPKDDKTGGPGSLTRESLSQAFDWLVNTLGLPREHVSGPRFAVRVYLHYRSSIVPDALLLNSFFLRDLARAKELAKKKALPATLAAYLGETSPDTRRDLLQDPSALEAALAPSKVPFGRWPTPASHTPSLLQQAAVNLAARMHGESGLLGVNGPPGTGKSTLLRDIVADNVVRRAQAMCAFAKPAKAFKVGFAERVRGETRELYALDPSLRGFEMVVVSSNNKAVENVSSELPALNALPKESQLRYFAPLASQVGERDAWGLIAAVLGNAANRSQFRKKFWTEGSESFQSYLSRVAGLEPLDETTSPEAAAEHPFGPQEALARWAPVRDGFIELQRRVQSRLDELESLRQALLQLPELKQREHDAEQRHSEAVAQCSATQEAAAVADAEADGARKVADDEGLRVKEHLQAAPGLLARLFGTSAARAWKSLHEELTVQWRLLAEYADSAAQTSAAMRQRAGAAKRAVVAWEGELQRAIEARKAAEDRCASTQVGPGAVRLDDEFHALPHGRKQLTLPWLDEEVQMLRAQLFERAMHVHKAFIDAAALPLRRNLKALMDANFNVHAKQAHLTADLWSSLFLVVPVVSTTFASVERMLGRVPNEALGWILVDEAGQATPQSAVGALMRAKRAIVVGDPQQIEPVVPLPDVLTAAVMREFAADPDRFSAPSASVQTLADDASDHCAVFQTAAGSRSVGVPLLVHRRCSSPMFEVSNRIAYGGLMVQGKVPQPSPIRDVVGPSRWIDVRGSAREKFSPEEGEQVLSLLRSLRDRAVAPDLYIVSPFVAVQDGLRQAITASGVLNGWVDEPRGWAWERVGTVHTVQGREAEAVIVVLGAPLPAQSGARQWAGRLPNLLNVAATRAKEAIYVVGNRQEWEGAGHFGVLSKHLS